MPAGPRHERSVLPRAVRQWILTLIPARYHLPARYYYRRLFGTTDPEIGLLRSLVRRDSVTIDVGSNLGVYTYALWKLSRRVEAFDPIQQYADLLRAFHADSIGIHEVALSSQPGIRTLHLVRDGAELDLGRSSLSPPTAGADAIDIPVRTLDEFGFTDVSFIKVDVEGHELDVLKGATELLARERPNLLIEIEQRHLSHPITVVFDYLRALGYEGFFFEQGTLKPLSLFSPQQHQDVTRLYTAGYINNFIFRS